MIFKYVQRLLGVLALVCCCFFPAHAGKSYDIRSLTANNGLSQFDISDIIQDSYGFIWIATYDGLNCYDGINNRYYRHQPDSPASISHNRIRTLFFDDTTKRLWIGTEGGGVNIFNYETAHFEHYYLGSSKDSGLLENEITDICANDSLSIWISTPNAVFLVDRQIREDRLNVLQTLRLEPDQVSRKIATACSNTMYLALNNSVLVYRKQNGVFGFVKECVFSRKQVLNEIYTDHKGNVWVITKGGILRAKVEHVNTEVKDRIVEKCWGGMEFEPFEFSSDTGVSSNDMFTAICQQRDGRYYVAVRDHGMFAWDGDTSPIHGIPIGLSKKNYAAENYIRTLFIDYSGTLWMGTTSRGIAYIDLNQKDFISLPFFPRPGSSESVLITQLLIDSGDRLWVGTQEEGLSVIDTKTQALISTDHSVNRILSIYETRKNDIWVAADGNVYQATLSDDGIKIFPIETICKLPSEYHQIGYPLSIAEDKTGNLWIGGRRGIVAFDPETGKLLHYETYGYQYHIRLIDDLKKNWIWVCTQRNGIILFDLDAENGVRRRVFEHHYQEENSLTSNTVWALLHTTSDEIYVGMDAGLNRLDPESGSVKRLSDSRIGSLRVVSITEDSRKCLWLNTSQGLFRFDPETEQIRIYNSTDGLLSNSLTASTILSEDNRIYLGTNEGINYFNPDSLSDNDIEPRVYITGFRLFNRPVSPLERINGRIILEKSILEAERIELSHSQNTIAFDFASFSFNNPPKNEFQYRLEGFDKDWQHVTYPIRTATYANLSPGEYVFQLRGSNNDGIFNRTVREVKVRIYPAPWASWWAYSLYVLFGLAVIYSVLRYAKERQNLRHKVMIDRIQHQAEQAANENKIRFYVNITHELRTPLSLIIAPLEQLEKIGGMSLHAQELIRTMKRNSQRMIELINQFLDLRKIDSQNLPLLVSYCDLVAVVRAVTERFALIARQKNIRFRFKMDEPTAFGYLDREKITKVVSNILSNAFKFTPEGGEIILDLSSDRENYTITVTDTGCGIPPEHQHRIFERFYQVSQNSSSGTGIGLELVKRLVELHKGNICLQSREGVGTTITVSIPFTSEIYADSEKEHTENISIETSDTKGRKALPENLRSNYLSVSDTMKELPIVLVVEDDDDMRNYICSLIRNRYDVWEARNGAEGLKIAMETVPDLIVTDVMMPEIDGIELCRRIKHDFRISHIPVIMLTAKNGELEGLGAGAIDYISKPFSPSAFCLKLANNLSYRPKHKLGQSVEKSYQQHISEFTEERERMFLEKAYSIVVANIDNDRFGIDQLTAELNISRAQLHRKLTALTGKSTSIFIRNIRLDRARQMLQTGKYTITEVLYSVGYNSPSYFSKTYKERYGEMPSEIEIVEDTSRFL